MSSIALEPRRMLAVTAQPSFDFDAPNKVLFDFSDNVQPSLSVSDLHFENLTTGDAVSSTLSYDSGTHIATFTPTGLPNGLLPSANYHATIFADAVIGPDGLPMEDDADLPFFFQLYDIWGLNLDGVPDRLVGLQDYNRLAAHMGQSGTYAQGDFNLDGIINLSDFNILAANFGAKVATMPEPGTLSVSQGAGQLTLMWNLGTLPPDAEGIRIQRSLDAQTLTALTDRSLKSACEREHPTLDQYWAACRTVNVVSPASVR